MELGLDGKVAVVTGASEGIGLAVTRRFVQEGVRAMGAGVTTTAVWSPHCDRLCPREQFRSVSLGRKRIRAGRSVSAEGVSIRDTVVTSPFGNGAVRRGACRASPADNWRGRESDLGTARRACCTT